MKKVGKIKLYKVGEVVKILEERFNYKIHPQNVCRKASILNAYITYNDINYLAEDIICYFATDLKKKATKADIKLIIQKKIEKIKKDLNIYENKHRVSPIKAIKNIKSQNTNTITIVKAVIQLKEEMQKIREQTQEEIQDKSEEIARLKKEMQKIREQTQEEIQDKSEEIARLKRAIQKIREETQEKIQIREAI
ncbi:hypothetical protein [Borrelia turicatae]|uniref:hypothetical protein n=1 Tax=Borrelia turicatae TaxID=142 RepID=UPI002ECFCE4C